MRCKPLLSAGALALLVVMVLSASCSGRSPERSVATQKGSSPRAASPRPYRLERVQGIPNSYRAYLGEAMYTVSATSPYRVVKGSLTGEDPTTLTSVPCGARPDITAVIPGHLVLVCNGGPVKQVLLVSVEDGGTAVVFQRRMEAPILSTAAWTGEWVYWRAVQWTEPGPFLAWGLVDGHGRPAPAEVMRRFAEVDKARDILNDLDGNLFLIRDRDGLLEKWDGTRFSPVGPLDGQRLEAAGDGQVVVSSIASGPPGEPGATTCTLESLDPPRKIRSWRVEGREHPPVVGMVYTIDYSAGLVDLYFPLQQKRYLFKDVFGEPVVFGGQVYFKSSQGWERLVITAPGTHTMIEPPGTGAFWR
ncbi:MAG: hypothetical protein QJR14_08695 [Bacillota bacterium]|nr:hypothetical protein [Bacillota bacterium]